MMTWGTAIRAWIDWQVAGAASEETIKLRKYQLRRLADDFAGRSPWDLQPDDLAAWMAAHRWSAESRRSYRAALRSFFGWAHASGYAGTDPARLLRKVSLPPPVPRPASELTIGAALDHADDRTWLLLMLGSRQGLRRGEMARVHTSDVSFDGHGWWIVVHGKGGKQRNLPLLAEIARAITQCPPGWVFPNGLGSHISPAYVGKLVRRCLADATTHQLRHRFATRSYRATHDIRAVQELLGHSSVATTQRYTAVAAEHLRAAVESAA